MAQFWRILILMLPGLLLTLRGNSANPINQSDIEVSQDLRPVLKEDESALTRLEEIEVDEDAEVKSSHPFASFINKSSIKEDNRNGLKNQRGPLRKSFFTDNSHRTWGSHPIGTRQSFVIHSENGDSKWIAYFYDQAVAAVLQRRNGTIIKCTVQENIQEWEQKAALEYLGEIMPLQPIPFHAMVHLITICGTLNMPPPPHRNSAAAGSDNLWWLDVSTLQGILPGTLWCGMRDMATYFHQLGSRQRVDSCCRAHDHCPIKLSSLTTRYGITNLGIKTLSHCSCDLEFYRCLKGAKSETARMVGQMFFNYLDMKCLDAPPNVKSRRLVRSGSSTHPSRASEEPAVETAEERNRKESGRLECVRVDREGGCRKWVLNPKDFTVRLLITQLGLKF